MWRWLWIRYKNANGIEAEFLCSLGNFSCATRCIVIWCYRWPIHKIIPDRIFPTKWLVLSTKNLLCQPGPTTVDCWPQLGVHSDERPRLTPFTNTRTHAPIRVYGVNRGQPYRTMEQSPSIRMVLQLWDLVQNSRSDISLTILSLDFWIISSITDLTFHIGTVATCAFVFDHGSVAIIVCVRGQTTPMCQHTLSYAVHNLYG